MTVRREFCLRVEILRDPDAVADRAVEIIRETIALPAPVLGVATGHTPLPIYERLRELAATGLSFSHLRSFALDEYCGLGPEDAPSYHAFLQQELFGPVGLGPDQWHAPDGLAEPDAEAHRYETAIRDAGGIDLQILGIGRNGHIGFNEPGSAFDSLTRRVTLSEDTKKANKRDFPPGQPVPHEALTMGIGTILRARKLLMVITGETKISALSGAIMGPITPDIPATALRLHPDATILADEAAAVGLPRI